MLCRLSALCVEFPFVSHIVDGQLYPFAAVPTRQLNRVHQFYAVYALFASHEQGAVPQYRRGKIVDDARMLRIFPVRFRLFDDNFGRAEHLFRRLRKGKAVLRVLVKIKFEFLYQ